LRTLRDDLSSAAQLLHSKWTFSEPGKSPPPFWKENFLAGDQERAAENADDFSADRFLWISDFTCQEDLC